MLYYVTIQGTHYGPADIQTLRQWVAEGRITRDTVLKDQNGAQIMAAVLLPELNQAQMGTTPYDPFRTGPGPGQQPYSPNPSGYGAQLYGQNPYSGFSNGADEYKKALTACLLGLGIGAFSLCCVPASFIGIFCEIYAIVLAGRAKRAGHRSAIAVYIASWLLLVLGILVAGFWLFLMSISTSSRS